MTVLDPLLRRLPRDQVWAGAAAAIASVAAARRAVVLHAHFGSIGPETGAAAKLVRRPWVLSLHGRDLLVDFTLQPRAATLWSAARVIVPSEFLAAEAVERGCPEDRIVVLPTGIPLDRYEYRRRRPLEDGGVLVVFVGRFVAKKGVLDLASALRQLAPDLPHLRARFVGHGPLEGMLRHQLATSGVPSEVVDGSDPDVVRRAFEDAHIVATPSQRAPDGDAETLCVVNLEAQACGIPIVTTRHGGILEGTSSRAAVFVEEGDVAALAEALRDLVRHEERWGAMGRAGRDHVERRFGLPDRVAQLERLYLDVAAEVGRRR